MVKIVSWNVNQRPLLDSVIDADVVLLQEAPGVVRSTPGWQVFPGPGAWRTGYSSWRTAVAVRQGSGLTAEPIPESPLHDAEDGVLGVSRAGTLTAVRISSETLSPIVVVSAYARWEHAHGGRIIYADANAHRILSDLTCLLTQDPPSVQMLVAGDWNLLRGYNEDGWPDYWRRRYDAVFARAELMGLHYAGPEHPHGRQADPWPAELPKESLCVPTFRSKSQTPATATRQLDHVLMTTGLLERDPVVAALNEPEEWGDSDHCRVSIQFA